MLYFCLTQKKIKTVHGIVNFLRAKLSPSFALQQNTLRLLTYLHFQAVVNYF